MVAALQQAGQAGGLDGHAPEVFDGNRKKADAFMYDFTIWAWINAHKRVMANPLSRVALAITYIKGDRVREWTKAQIRAANNRVNAGIPSDSDEHWNQFRNDFVATWKDDTLLEDAQFKLQELSMKKDMPIHEYISTFNALITELGWDANHPGTVRAFRMGLRSWIATAILRKDLCPAEDDLEGWQDAARKEVSKAQRIKQEAGGYGRGGLTVRENIFKQFLQDHKGSRKAPKDPDAMDIDAISTKPGGRFKQLTNEEKKKLMAEGRCFRCKKQGHMSRNCPDKKGGSKPFERRSNPSARTTEAEENNASDEEDKDEVMSQASTKVGSTKGKGVLAAQINALSVEEKEELFDKLISEGF